MKKTAKRLINRIKQMHEKNYMRSFLLFTGAFVTLRLLVDPFLDNEGLKEVVGNIFLFSYAVYALYFGIYKDPNLQE